MYSRYACIRRSLFKRRILFLMYKTHCLTNATYHYHNQLFVMEQGTRAKIAQLNKLQSYADKVLSRYDHAPMQQLMKILDQVPEQLRAYKRIDKSNARELSSLLTVLRDTFSAVKYKL